MSILDEVRRSLQHEEVSEDDTSLDLDEALQEAERLADMYSHIQPQPYVVPLQRFIGVPVYRDTETSGT